MGKFQQYLEWLPERFEQAKREGKLDIKPEKKEIPAWFKTELRWRNPDRYAEKQNPDDFPSDYVGIVATKTAIYCFDRNHSYHASVILGLMNDGIVPIEHKNFRYHEGNIKMKDVVCLEYRKDDNLISFSTAYRNNTFQNEKDRSKFNAIFNKLKKQGHNILFGQKH